MARDAFLEQLGTWSVTYAGAKLDIGFPTDNGIDDIRSPIFYLKQRFGD
jgi:hypothetical protein